MKRILPIQAAGYARHPIHTLERQWIETNCYSDVWIELLHAAGHDPVAALPFTLSAEFEGDQWTFFKFSPTDLYELYGLDVKELMIWLPLERQIEEQLGHGRHVLVEVDSFYLPDTAGMSYQIEHTKSTIAVNEIDIENARMGYFHGQGYYDVSGDDFRHLFHLIGEKNPAILPPYAEFVKKRPVPVPLGADLTRASLNLLRRELSIPSEGNPFLQFKERFQADLNWLSQESLDTFHKYSFATLRQFGACFELAATYLKWLRDRGVERLDAPIEGVESLSTGAKTMQFQLARAMNRKKPMDLTPLEAMAGRWQSATDQLKSLFL